MSEPRWYAAGLRFECQRCGHCCRGAGTVLVDEAEIAALADRLELADAEFRAIYTRRLRDGALSLREQRNRDCVFYDRDHGCRVYEDRPRQCRSWPFWRGVVHSAERWAEEAEHCPGMNRGRLHPEGRIEATRRHDGTRGSAPPPVVPAGAAKLR
jgi:Fe-S-cluster containining protein